jgi:hypothetical protein
MSTDLQRENHFIRFIESENTSRSQIFYVTTAQRQKGHKKAI